MSKPKIDKRNHPDYIFNPTTERWVLRRNRTGKRVQKLMSSSELKTHINHHATATMMENRELIKSGMTDAQLESILRKVVDIRIDEALGRHMATLPKDHPILKRAKRQPAKKCGPPHKLKLKRQVGLHKAPTPDRRSKGQSRRKRFVIKKPPPPDTTTDAGETTDALSDTASGLGRATVNHSDWGRTSADEYSDSDISD